MPTWIDHALFLILAVFGPVWAATFGMRRLLRAERGELPRVRSSVYRLATVVQWSLAGALLVQWLATRRAWTALGVVPLATWGLGGVTLGLLIVVALALRQRAQILSDDASLAEVRWKLRRLERMMPRTPRELRGFYRLSVTAGVCEELLYRGFLIWYLIHWFGLLPAAGIAAAIFGLGHTYQGWRGVLTTGAVGAFLAGVYVVTGSLVASMVFHALMDIHSGNLAFHAFTRVPEGLGEGVADAPAGPVEWVADAPAGSAEVDADAETPAASRVPGPSGDGAPTPREGQADVEHG